MGDRKHSAATWSYSSVWSERFSYKEDVEGSNPPGTTMMSPTTEEQILVCVMACMMTGQAWMTVLREEGPFKGMKQVAWTISPRTWTC